MPEFASPAWLTAFDEAVRDDPDVAAAAAGIRVVVQQELDDTGEVWHIAIGDGTVRVVGGRASAPDVTMRQARGTAESIHRGELSAQEAFMDGRLQLAGDVSALVGAAAVFAAFDRSTAILREA